MRRLMAIAEFALMLAVPVWAQRGGHGGGGHVGGGGMRGGFVARGGHFGGGHSSAGMRGGMRSGPRSMGFSQSATHGSWHGNHRFHDRNSRNRRFRNNCFGSGCSNWAGWGWGYPSWGWGGGWGYDPAWWWGTWEDEDRRFDEDYYRQYEMARRWNEDSLAEQQMRRQQDEEDGDQDAYAPRSYHRSAATENAMQPAEPGPTTVLVFRDQRKQEVQNYAIVGQTLWAFSAGKTQKIPLAGLDVAATEKANDDRGLTFRAPTASQGQ